LVVGRADTPCRRGGGPAGNFGRDARRRPGRLPRHTVKGLQLEIGGQVR